MRILFLAKRRYTNKDALRERFGRIYQLPLQWHRAGHNVELTLIDYLGRHAERSAPDGFAVCSLPAMDPRTPRRTRKQALEFAPDVVVGSGDCFMGVAAFSLAKKSKVPFVFDVYDDYASMGNHRAFLGFNAFHHLLQRASLVFYAGNALARQHPSASPWTLVPNGVDPLEFHPIPMAEARARSAIEHPGQKVVGYFGSMEPNRGVDDLIAAVGQVHAQDSSVNLLLCGTPPRRQRLLPQWVDYRGVVPHASIPDFLNACDVLVLPYRRGQTMDMGASCKIAEYLLCRRPMVATDTPNFVGNFPSQAAQLGDGICRPSDPNDLARAIRSQLEHPRIAASPLDFTWQRIARDALVAIQSVRASTSMSANQGQ